MTVLDHIGSANAWNGIITIPMTERISKPRNCGLTMVIDKGLGINDTSELLAVAGNYIDYIKLGFGTAALYNPVFLEKKISLVKDCGVEIFPGGTFFEIAILQNKMVDFLNRAWEIGFTTIEVSDGTIPMSKETRRRAIKTAAALGFKVISEVGKKDPADNMSPRQISEQVKFDLDAGAGKVILEARESGTRIGIFDEQGEVNQDKLESIVGELPGLDCIIWEAPLKKQQQELIIKFGPNVNLGNIPPGEALALETLRLGLRGDTLKTVMSQYLSGCILFTEKQIQGITSYRS